jgi:hypothetical protein
MQTWQITAFELEAAGLEYLDGFIHEHALGFFNIAIGLLLALLAWVLSGAVRDKGGNSHVRPVLFIHLPGPPQPPPDTFDPLPPPHHSMYDDHRDDYEE